jgi:hypothetical protein
MNDRTWLPDLEWVVNAANFQKIIDGKYNKWASLSLTLNMNQLQLVRPSLAQFATKLQTTRIWWNTAQGVFLALPNTVNREFPTSSVRTSIVETQEVGQGESLTATLMASQSDLWRCVSLKRL